MRYRQFFFVAWAHEWFCCVRDLDSPIRTTTEAQTITHYYKQTEPKWSCAEFMLLSSSVHTHTTMMMMMMIVDSFSLDGSLVHPLVFGISLLCVHGMRSVNCSLSLSRTWSFFFFSVTLFVVVVAIYCCCVLFSYSTSTSQDNGEASVWACVCLCLCSNVTKN